MSTFTIIALLLAATLLMAMALVRTADVAPQNWHVEPARVDAPPDGSAARIGDAAPTFPAPPEQVLTALDAVAAERPRARRIAGSPEEGLVTWEIRSKVWGFPDYLTAQAIPDGDATRLDVVSRLRFGENDLGVNAARLDDWLADLSARLEPQP